MVANHTIHATFTAKGPYTITTLPGAGGTMSPSNPPVACGAEQKIAIVPDHCFLIASVTVDGVAVAVTNTVTFTNVQGTHTVEATFAPAGPFTITAAAGPGGTVNPTSVVVPCGDGTKIVITPNHGFEIATITVDGHDVGPVTGSYVFTDVQANHALVVTFDVSTAVVITRLESESVADGVAIKWLLAFRDLFVSLDVERSVAEAGPWAAIAVDMHDEGDLTVAMDKSAGAGQSFYYRLVGTTAAGARAVFGPLKGTAGAPKEFSLSNIGPNPSRSQFALLFTVARSAQLKLSLVDLMGRDIATLAKGAYAPGRYQVNWDGRTDRGRVPAGLYFVRYQTPGKTFVQRLVVAQ